MPELPEVEIVRVNLAGWLARRTVERVVVHDTRIVGAGGLAPRALAGKRIVRVERRGKRLRVATSGGPDLYSHLGMTGDWVELPASAPAERFEKVRIDLSGGRSVRYLDARLLGRIVVAKEPPRTWTALGPDPLVDGLDARVLGARLAKRRRRAIKEVLMDQQVIAGVGNILAQEALFRARVDPRRVTETLTPAEVKRLAAAIHAAIRANLADQPFSVYGKAGQRCRRCKTTLVRIVQNARSTVYCPRCQT